MEAKSFQELVEEFHFIGSSLCKKAKGISKRQFLQHRKYIALFGTTPPVCARLWILLKQYRSLRGEKKHLMWALLFLKTYATESVLSCIIGSDEKTIRKRFWIYIDALAELPLVSVSTGI